MSKLYLITGPAGVGKSTISNAIAHSLKKSVLIEGDEIYHQVIGGYISPWLEGNHLDLFWQVCINIIKIYLKNNYDVVFNYIIEKEDLEYITSHIEENEIKFVCLLVEKETLLKRDKERPEDCQMKERCIVLLNNFKNNNYAKKNILYTDNLSIEETKNKIINDDYTI